MLITCFVYLRGGIVVEAHPKRKWTAYCVTNVHVGFSGAIHLDEIKH